MEPGIPKGFLEKHSNGCLVIGWRRSLGCLSCFCAAFLACFTFAPIFVISSYLLNGKMDDGSPIQLWFPIAACVGWLVAATFCLPLIFTEKRFVFLKEKLIIESKVLFVRWKREIEKSTIQNIKLVKDGGEGDDSFATWGVRAEYAKSGFYFFFATKIHCLLPRVEKNQATWFHQRVSKWAESGNLHPLDD